MDIRTDQTSSLSDRLQERAETARRGRAVPVVRRVIEAREVLQNLRATGLSWEVLADLLSQEGVTIGPGTLRNYMRLVGRAEMALKRAGEGTPTDHQIHASLYRKPEASPGRDPPLELPDCSPAAVVAPAPPKMARNHPVVPQGTAPHNSSQRRNRKRDF